MLPAMRSSAAARQPARPRRLLALGFTPSYCSKLYLMTGTLMTAGSIKGGRGLLATFDCIRIISLPARLDRRRSASVQLGKLGATIDGDAIAFHDAVRPSDAGAFDTVGTRGCFLSHLEVLKAARQAGVANLLILEDDVGFSRSERAAMPGALAMLLRQDWGIFYGGSPVEPLDSPLTPLEPDTSALLAHFIAFSAPVIKQLIPFLEAILTRPAGSPEGGPMHVDGAYGWFRRAHPDIRALAATPHLAHQTASRTDIHQLRGLDRVALLHSFLRLLRTGKNKLRDLA